MRQREADLDALDVRVAVVTFEADHFARAYAEESGLDWPLLVDTDRSLYRAYGMEQGRWRDILGPAAWAAYFRLLARGAKLKRSQGDVAQLGGDVLIDPDGIVRLHHVGEGPADRPSVDQLMTTAAR